jgi:hypothetical protein
MGHYKSNLRDLEFILFEMLGRQEILGQGAYEEIDEETGREILREVARLAENELADSFIDADRNPPVFDPDTNGHHAGVLQEVVQGVLRRWLGHVVGAR